MNTKKEERLYMRRKIAVFLAAVICINQIPMQTLASDDFLVEESAESVIDEEENLDDDGQLLEDIMPDEGSYSEGDDLISDMDLFQTDSFDLTDGIGYEDVSSDDGMPEDQEAGQEETVSTDADEAPEEMAAADANTAPEEMAASDADTAQEEELSTDGVSASEEVTSSDCNAGTEENITADGDISPEEIPSDDENAEWDLVPDSNADESVPEEAVMQEPSAADTGDDPALTDDDASENEIWPGIDGEGWEPGEFSQDDAEGGGFDETIPEMYAEEENDSTADSQPVTEKEDPEDGNAESELADPADDDELIYEMDVIEYEEAGQTGPEEDPGSELMTEALITETGASLMMLASPMRGTGSVNDAALHFEVHDGSCLYTDGSLPLTAVAEGLDMDAYTCSLDIHVYGTDETGNEYLMPEDAYTVENIPLPEEGILTAMIVLNGTAFVSFTGYRADAILSADGAVQQNDDIKGEVRKPQIRYEHELNQTLLPGWGRDINGHRAVFIEDSEHPNGEWLFYDVISVEQIGGDECIQIRRDENDQNPDDYWWHYDALRKGTADLEIRYADIITGQEQSYQITITVMSDVYGVDLWANTSVRVLPGGTVQLQANARHWRENAPETNEGLTYEWSATDGDMDLAEIIPGSDGSTASVTMNPGDGQPHDVCISVIVYEDGERRADNSLWLSCSSAYLDISPTAIEQIQVGEETSERFEVRQYSADYDPEQPYVVLNDEQELTYSWEFNPDAVSVFFNGNAVGHGEEILLSAGTNPVFTIRRLQNWNEQIRIHVYGEGVDEYREYWLNEQSYHVWIDRPENTCLYTDGEIIYYVNADSFPQKEGWDLSITAGWMGEEDWEIIFQEGTDYIVETEYDSDTGITSKKVTISGAAGGYSETDPMRYTLYAAVTYNGETMSNGEWADGETRLPRTEYNREYDRFMLPGWDGTIDWQYDGYEENGEYPDGRDFRYFVTDVTVLEGEELLDTFHWDSENKDDPEAHYWWYYEAGRCGTVKLKVTYLDLNGEECSYIFHLFIGSDVYNVQVWTNGPDTVLPGGSVELEAAAEHWDIDNVNSTAGCTYTWTLEEGEQDGIVLTPDPDDERKAVVTFPSWYEDWHNCDAIVTVKVFADGEERAQNDIRVKAEDDYTEILPLRLQNLQPGETAQESLEVRHYGVHIEEEESYLAVNAVYPVSYCFHFDPDTVELLIDDEYVTDGEWFEKEPSSDPAVLTLRRLRNAGTRIFADAFWDEPDEKGSGRRIGAHQEYDLPDFGYQVWIDRPEDTRLYNDGIRSFEVYASDYPQIDGWEFVLTVGERDGDEWGRIFTENEEYTIEEEYIPEEALTKYTVILTGDRVSDAGAGSYTIRAALLYQDEIIEEDWADGEVKQSWADYDREWDRDLLPGWDGGIDWRYRVHVENSEYPDGTDMEYCVTDVEILEGSDILDLHRDSDDENDPEAHYWWTYRALRCGNALLKVSCSDIEGNPWEYEFWVHVNDDVYSVDVSSDSYYNALPGDSIHLSANARHSSTDYSRDNHTDSILYVWSVDENQENCVDHIEYNGSHAVVCFRDYTQEELEEWRDYEACIRVYTYELENGWPMQRAQNDVRLRVSPEPVQVIPGMIDGDLDPGQSRQLDMKVLRYTMDHREGEALTDDHHVSYFWHFDPEVVDIRYSGVSLYKGEENGEQQFQPVEASEPSFTILRRRQWGTNLAVDINWTDESGNNDRWEHREYHLNDMNYHIWFEDGFRQIREDGEAVLTPVTEDLGSLDYTIDYELTGRTRDDVEVSFGAGEYTVDGSTLTVSGAAMQRKEAEQVHVNAIVKYNDEELCRAETEIELRHYCEEHDHRWTNWFTLKKPDCTDTGLKMRFCYNAVKDYWYACGKVEYEEIPAVGHSMQRVAAIPATLEEEGNIQYWFCKECGRLYADASAQTQLRPADVVIPRLISLADADVTLSKTSLVYTGSAQTVTAVVKLGGRTLISGTDYTLSCSGNVSVGTAAVTIKGKGVYGGSLTRSFTITPKSISGSALTVAASAVYTGAAIKPSVTVKDGTVTLVNGTDYTVAYTANTNVGTATVTVTGKGNYNGTKKGTFKITPKAISSVSATLSKTSLVYNGKAQTVAVTVKDGTRTLTSGTDYTLSYANNTNAGTASITITGKGNYTSTKKVTFSITGKPVSGTTVTLSKTSLVYNGKAQTVTVTVKDGTTTLTNGTHYTLSYAANTNVGTATITITGKGNYSGTKKVTFKITAKAISSAAVTLSKTALVYTGKAQTVTVTVKDGTTVLKSGTHYTLAYAANTNVGTATITITGKGNYGGTKKVTFKINPKAAVISSLTSTTAKQAVVKWAKIAGVTGYEIQYSLSSTFASGNKSVKAAGAATLTKTVTALTSGKTYYVRIRTYQTVSGTTYYSAWSAAKSIKVK